MTDKKEKKVNEETKEEDKKEETKEEVKEEVWMVREVPSAFSPAAVNEETEEIFLAKSVDEAAYMCKVLNTQEKLQKELVG